MPVAAACGNQVGTVAEVEGVLIRLIWDTPGFRGNYRYIPFGWVDCVGEAICLKRSCEEMRADWRKSRQSQPGTVAAA